MKKTVPFFLLLFLADPFTGSTSIPPALSRDSFSVRLTMLRDSFGHYKQLEPALELECLAALSFFPELRKTRIRFRFGKTHSTMESRPDPACLLLPGQDRRYEVVIRYPGNSRTGLHWTDLSFPALVGWLGHELSHIVYYEEKTRGGILFTGIKYLLPGWRKKYERFTDIVTIRHGLGPALAEGLAYTLEQPSVSFSYKKYLRRYYLGLSEIRNFDSLKHQFRIQIHQTRFIQQDKYPA